MVRDYSVLNIDVLRVYTQRRLAGPPDPLAFRVWLLWFKLDVEALGGSRKDAEQQHGARGDPPAGCSGWVFAFGDRGTATRYPSRQVEPQRSHPGLAHMQQPPLFPSPSGRRRQGGSGRAAVAGQGSGKVRSCLRSERRVARANQRFAFLSFHLGTLGSRSGLSPLLTFQREQEPFK